MIINYNETIYEVTKLSTVDFIKELDNGIDIYRISDIVWERLEQQNIYKLVDEKGNVYYIDNINTYLNPIQLLAWHDMYDEEREVPDFYGIYVYRGI